MRVVLQRSKEAKVTVDGKVTGKIDKGYVLLSRYYACRHDRRCEYLARKWRRFASRKMKKGK